MASTEELFTVTVNGNTYPNVTRATVEVVMAVFLATHTGVESGAVTVLAQEIH
jgi:hypothetical protein